jgi:MscS family membrane protein
VFLAGLGIGGLAFALAAQDTIANVFGAVVVAIDQPFRIGETVQIAGHTGTVEDVGVRSMRLRRPDKAVVVIPNKTVASESIVNLSKFTNRRVEQVLGFTYGSTPEQLIAIVADIKALLAAEPEVQQSATQVYFRDFSASSLDVWVVDVTKEGDFNKHMELRQRLNLAFMRAAAARGMGFAFPTQTIDLAPSAAKVLGK